MTGSKTTFYVSLLTSFLVHIFVLVLLFSLPKPPLPDIPFKELKIRLGSSNAIMQALNTSSPVETKEVLPSIPVAKPVIDSVVNKKKTDEIKKQNTATFSRKEKVAALKQDKVLESAPNIPQPALEKQQTPQEMGEALGNTRLNEAEALTRYTQLLSGWIDTFVPRPETPKGINGIGQVFITIDRDGNIIYYEISQSAGHPELDNALRKIISSSNPVIPIPESFDTAKKNFSFIIPISLAL